MLGAIAGDVIGSVFEWDNVKSKDFPLFSAESSFTDDTVLTVAVAESLLLRRELTPLLKDYARHWPDAGYGARFIEWATGPDTAPYQSWGNGAAMRISPVAWAFDDLDEVLAQAEAHTAVTHDHPEGIKGAQATAAAILLARTGGSKARIKAFVESRFGYDLSRTLAQIRPHYGFDESCQGTVPQAITAFLEADDFEDAIRNAISLGGDSDTLACITGSIAEAFFGGVPGEIALPVLKRLDAPLLNVTRMFCQAYGLAREHFAAL